MRNYNKRFDRMAELKRALGLWELTLSGVGIILGAGIYALIGKAAGLAGNGLWISFVIGAIVAVLTGLSYAELSSMFPKAGAEYEYTKNAFGRKIAFLIGWLIAVSGIFSATTVALGFAGYFNALFSTPLVLTGVVLIILLGLLMLYGIKETALFAIIGTIFEAGGLVLIIIFALPHFGSVDYFNIPSWDGVFAAASLIFFAYIGFEEMTRMAEEVKNPERNMPLGLILAIAITTVLYILVGISAISVVDYHKLAISQSPLADVVSVTIGKEIFFIFGIIALFATGNTVLLVMVATSRLIYGMAAAGGLPDILAYVHPTRQTPWVAIILTVLFSSLFFVIGGIEKVAAISNLTVYLTFIAINLALIRLRYEEPTLARPFKTPFSIGKMPVLPLFAIASCIFMIANVETDAIIYGVATLIIGAIVLFFLTKNENKKK